MFCLNTYLDEEQEQLQRAIQLSMMETTSTNTDLTRMGMIEDVKTRTDDAPCGMRNVGSSCWYNAVIQCMFHVPALRRRILSSELRGTSLSTEFDAIRKTFTLLKGSKKSTIETADYVQVFKAHMPSGSTQQDVSEFVHKLLDVCESALKPEGTANAENPIKKLFYGTLKEIGKTDEEKVSVSLFYSGTGSSAFVSGGGTWPSSFVSAVGGASSAGGGCASSSSDLGASVTTGAGGVS